MVWIPGRKIIWRPRSLPYPQKMKPKFPYKRTRLGLPRYDREIAPQLVQNGANNYKQKPGAYAKALLDPEKNSSCVIPDLSSYPTSTYSIRATISAAASATGIHDFVLYGNGTMQYALGTGASTDAVYAVAAPNQLPGATNIASTYVRHRLVGMSLRIEFAGSDSQNSGTVTATSYTQYDSTPTSLGQQQQTRNTITTVLRDGAVAIYKPVDGSNYDMVPTTVNTVQYGFLYMHVSGAAANSKITYHVTEHWEGISLTDGTTGAYEPEGGKVYVNAHEFNTTQSIISRTTPVYDGPSYINNNISRAVNAVSAEIGRQVENLTTAAVTGALTTAGTMLMKSYAKSKGSKYL